MLLYFAACTDFHHLAVSNGNRTEWSPIRSVIIRVITKSDDRTAGVRFVYHDHQLIIKITISEKRRIPRYEKGKFTLKVFTMFLCFDNISIGDNKLSETT